MVPFRSVRITSTVFGLLFFYLTPALAQEQTFELERETLYLNNNIKILSQNGDRRNGQLSYDTHEGLVVVDYEAGYRTRQRRFYHDSILCSDISYWHGARHGPARECDQQGQVISVGNYVNDLKDGRWIFYYPNGTIKMDIGFITDTARLIPSFTINTHLVNPDPPYDETSIGVIHSGHSPPHGEWIYYDEHGTVKNRLEFDRGVLIYMEVPTY
ncbi:MAG: toxin-antitoxin system YwqK family antitoxin [Bacteroidota bacterium]|jgi:antitoxin component YwqK of YwqJK toxin-antitoxin module